VRCTARQPRGGFAKMTYPFDSGSFRRRASVSHRRTRATDASECESLRRMAPLIRRFAAAGFLTFVAACQQPGDQYQAASQECVVWAAHTWQATSVTPEPGRRNDGNSLPASGTRPCVVHIPRVSIEQASDHWR
jgi:hypothetical protein